MNTQICGLREREDKVRQWQSWQHLYLHYSLPFTPDPLPPHHHSTSPSTPPPSPPFAAADSSPPSHPLTSATRNPDEARPSRPSDWPKRFRGRAREPRLSASDPSTISGHPWASKWVHLVLDSINFIVFFFFFCQFCQFVTSVFQFVSFWMRVEFEVLEVQLVYTFHKVYTSIYCSHCTISCKNLKNNIMFFVKKFKLLPS